MTQVEDEVVVATRRLYDAIEDMISGRGAQAMSEAWHHDDQVTSRHPMDQWSVGWDQVWATWSFTATFGREDRGGSHVLDLRPYVYGDVAYCTVTFQAAPAWGGERIMCTNVLHLRSGQWKVVHHHADPSASMQKALEKMIAES